LSAGILRISGVVAESPELVLRNSGVGEFALIMQVSTKEQILFFAWSDISGDSGSSVCVTSSASPGLSGDAGLHLLIIRMTGVIDPQGVFGLAKYCAGSSRCYSFNDIQ